MSKKTGDFEKKVDRCRKNDSAELIDNAAWEHAVYLFKSLLGVAAEKHETVRIVTGTFNSRFYNDLKEQIKSCIESDSDIEVTILDSEEGDLDPDHEIISLIKNYAKGRLYFIPEGVSFSLPHMLLIGDQGQRFRLEIDHSQTKAIASFNNPAMGKTLLEIYNLMLDRINTTEKKAACI